MKYPLNTVSKPVVGSQAKRLLKAVREGKPLANAAAQATINRIIARRRDHDAGLKTAE